ncbi:MAG TPA: hypothetical protein VM143_06885 [Acidimicrobiales bacterium]|nr:hypothetical protein [Acidimicrobiales bacterium]
MAKVSVTPQEFHFVKFDAAQVEQLTAKLADQIGLPADAAVEIDIDEATPAGRARTESLDPIKLHIEGGALEEPTAPRTLSERLSADVIGKLLLRAHDRSAADFGTAPADGELDLAQQTAWDTACMGRLERLGYDVRKPRRLYHFRNRHGFTDVADNVFNRLWAAERVTWADIEAACAETASARASA